MKRQETRRGMTLQEALHLETWLNRVVFEGDRESVRKDILTFLVEYPDLLAEGRSWPEIRVLAERD